MPLGVDTYLYTPRDDELIFESGIRRVLFVSVGGWNWRKGWDVLLKSYFRAFTSRDDVSLLLVTRGVNFESELNSILGELVPSNAPHITVSTSKLNENEMSSLYSRANAFVLFPRGEGWCLPYCEAGACGTPVIGSYQGGQMAFMDENDPLLIKPDCLVEVDCSMRRCSDIYEGTIFADYSDDAIDDASSKMKLVIDSPYKALESSLKFRSKLLEKYDWRESSKLVYNRLTELQK